MGTITTNPRMPMLPRLQLFEVEDQSCPIAIRNLATDYIHFMVPLVPLICWWDGVVSQLRAYTAQELENFGRSDQSHGLLLALWSRADPIDARLSHLFDRLSEAAHSATERWGYEL